MSAAMQASGQSRCRFCGCTAENPCISEFGDECAFLGAKADRCSNKSCVLAFDRERDQERMRDAQQRKMQVAVRKPWTRRKGGRA